MIKDEDKKDLERPRMISQVWVGLQSGSLQVFRRSPSGSWDTSPAISIVLGSDPVTALVSQDNHDDYIDQDGNSE